MRYLVVGQGITAKSVVAHCERQAVPCAQIDTLDALADVDQSQFDCLVISPGLDRRHPAIQALLAAGVQVIGDIELFMQAFSGKVIAVTGSNGKSTTVSMTDHVLRASGYRSALGGNIGLAALDLLIDPPEIAVLELSSFQLESTPSMHSSVATVLNVTEDHLDRYTGMDDYAQTKRHIYQQADLVISNADDVLTHCDGPMQTVPVARILERKSIWLGNDRWADVDGISGVNVVNASFAFALVQPFGVTPDQFCSALASFVGLSHRNEFVAEIGGVRYINDSKATNPGSTVAAIQAQSAPVYLILGGQTKGADLTPVLEAVRVGVKGFVTLGVDAPRFEALLPAELHLGRVQSIEAAVASVADKAVEGDVCLLSPAAASLDMFENYQVRGARFAAAVQALAEKGQ